MPLYQILNRKLQQLLCWFYSRLGAGPVAGFVENWKSYTFYINRSSADVRLTRFQFSLLAVASASVVIVFQIGMSGNQTSEAISIGNNFFFQCDCICVPQSTGKMRVRACVREWATECFLLLSLLDCNFESPSQLIHGAQRFPGRATECIKLPSTS